MTVVHPHTISYRAKLVSQAKSNLVWRDRPSSHKGLARQTNTKPTICIGTKLQQVLQYLFEKFKG